MYLPYQACFAWQYKDPVSPAVKLQKELAAEKDQEHNVSEWVSLPKKRQWYSSHLVQYKGKTQEKLKYADKNCVAKCLVLELK